MKLGIIKGSGILVLLVVAYAFGVLSYSFKDGHWDGYVSFTSCVLILFAAYRVAAWKPHSK